MAKALRWVTSKRWMVASVVTAALLAAALAVFIWWTWPALTEKPARIALSLFAFLFQFAGAVLVIRGVLSSDRVDREFRNGIAEVARIRDEQRERVATDLASLARPGVQIGPAGAIRRALASDGWRTVAQYGANNLGQVGPKLNDTLVDYLAAKTNASTTERWIGVVFSLLGIAFGLAATLAGNLA